MLRRFAPQCSAMISAAKSRVISHLRRGYIRPSGGLCFAAAGGKANVCRTWRHIFIDGAHGWKSVRGAGAPSPPSEEGGGCLHKGFEQADGGRDTVSMCEST